ncbi:MAG: hypothetical protein ACI8U3_000102 [Brevundimonas sp.]|jgi:hypothetical protein
MLRDGPNLGVKPSPAPRGPIEAIRPSFFAARLTHDRSLVILTGFHRHGFPFL